MSNEEPKEKVYACLSSVAEPAILPWDSPMDAPKYRLLACAILYFVGQVAKDKVRQKIKIKSFEFLFFIFVFPVFYLFPENRI